LLPIALVYRPPAWFDWCAVRWGRAILAAAGVRLTIEGSEYAMRDPSGFFLGNHQSALDIPVMFVALRGRVRFLAKESLFRIPVLGWVLSSYGHIPIDRSHARVALSAIERIMSRPGCQAPSIVVFPEGTRSVDGQLLPFRRGVMKICQRAGAGVVPFSIAGTAAIHRRGRFCIRSGPVRLTFAEPIVAAEVVAMTSTELHDRVRAAIARGFGETFAESPAETSAKGNRT
ncbi:MAG: 1-acyl-sn-glycerol-3-phosphate acyltransferase, partial [Planctomycetes bacterium]|nr:1-acyl-sn-glycerol-3-phosphate acyltransferase [Planctomycetota bacterium]